MSQFTRDQIVGFLEEASALTHDENIDNIRIGFTGDVLNHRYGYTDDDLVRVARLSPEAAEKVIELSRGEEPGFIASVGSAISGLFNSKSDPAPIASEIMHTAQNQYQASVDARIDRGVNGVPTMRPPGT